MTKEPLLFQGGSSYPVGMTVETTAARRQRLGLKCVTVELDEEFHLLLRKIAGKQLWTQRAAIEESIRLMAKRLKLLEE